MRMEANEKRLPEQELHSVFDLLREVTRWNLSCRKIAAPLGACHCLYDADRAVDAHAAAVGRRIIAGGSKSN